MAGGDLIARVEIFRGSGLWNLAYPRMQTEVYDERKTMSLFNLYLS